MPRDSEALFREKLAFGEEGEHAIVRKLVERGCSVAPLYQYQNHEQAPFLLEGFSSRVLPDATCWGNGKCFFAEVKRKNRWVGPGFINELETGFDLRHFREYSRVAEVTGSEVHLFFVHQTREPTGVFTAPLSRIASSVREWDGKAPNGRKVSKPLALFPKSLLNPIWTLDEVGLARAA